MAHLRLPTRPLHLPLIRAIRAIRAIRDTTVVVKKVAQNPAVLASYYK